MTFIDVLVLGNLERAEDGSVVPEGTWSTSTLIRTDDGHNIVVDTSQRYMGSAIKTSFKQIGKIFPDDVDMVVLTHGHSDHIGNNGMFRNAKIIKFTGGEKVPGATEIDKEKEIARGVRFVRTPGHTEDSGSVFVDADKRYAIVGDAAPLQANIVDKKVPALNCDPEAAKASMGRIVRYADVVVPGHGKPFNVTAYKKSWL